MFPRKQGQIYPLALRSWPHGLRNRTLTIGASSVIWLSISATYVGYHWHLRLTVQVFWVGMLTHRLQCILIWGGTLEARWPWGGDFLWTSQPNTDSTPVALWIVKLLLWMILSCRYFGCVFFWRLRDFAVSDNILYQDNKSAMILETNGCASSSKRTRHIEIWYYYVAIKLPREIWELSGVPRTRWLRISWWSLYRVRHL